MDFCLHISEDELRIESFSLPYLPFVHLRILGYFSVKILWTINMYYNYLFKVCFFFTVFVLLYY